MHVKIDSGKPEAWQSPEDVSESIWPELLTLKRDFVKIRIFNNFCKFLEFVEDAEVMFEELGYDSVKDMLIRGYEVELREVGIALEWVNILDAKKAAKFNRLATYAE